MLIPPDHKNITNGCLDLRQRKEHETQENCTTGAKEILLKVRLDVGITF